jgi:hypothetical protein
MGARRPRIAHRARLASLGLTGVICALTACRAADPTPSSPGAGAPVADPAEAARPGRKSSRTPARKPAASNMPRNFTWPPSAAMRRAEAACERALDTAGIAWKPASPEGRIASPLIITDGKLGGISYTPVYGKGPYKLDCQLALALHTIGPALVTAGVREVRFGSIYRWSNVRVGGVTKPTLSRHALGLAMDVVSFVDGQGRDANVARDYPAGDALLRDVEQAINDSGEFRLVLTPQNDPISHKDHFHLEATPTYARAAQKPGS